MLSFHHLETVLRLSDPDPENLRTLGFYFRETIMEVFDSYSKEETLYWVLLKNGSSFILMPSKVV